METMPLWIILIIFAYTVLPRTTYASDLSEFPDGQLAGATDETLRQPLPGSEMEEADVREVVDVEENRRHRHQKSGKHRHGGEKRKITEMIESKTADYDNLETNPEPVIDDIKTEAEINEVKNGMKTEPNVNGEEEVVNIESIVKEDDASSTQSTNQNPVTGSEVPVCENCLDKQTLIQLQIERIKKTLLARLGLDSPPKVVGEIPPLPFDFYRNEEFAMSDEEYRKQEREEEERLKPKIREIFIKGTDSKTFLIVLSLSLLLLIMHIPFHIICAYVICNTWLPSDL